MVRLFTVSEGESKTIGVGSRLAGRHGPGAGAESSLLIQKLKPERKTELVMGF